MLKLHYTIVTNSSTQDTLGMKSKHTRHIPELEYRGTRPLIVFPPKVIYLHL